MPDPTDPSGINAFVHAASAESLQPLSLASLTITEDGIEQLAKTIRGETHGPVLIVQDNTPMARGGEDLKGNVLAAVQQGTAMTLHEPGVLLHADLRQAKSLSTKLDGFAAVVAVGSGTVTDIAKYARHLHAERSGQSLPFICFPTAASVTAYTSALAVLRVAGVKRTLPAAGPDHVICDLPTLCGAPRPMVQAGFGDVLARSVSAGDWWLANQLGMDDGFDEAPIRLLTGAEQRMIDAAAGVAAGHGASVECVLRALLLAGMAMSVARQTAPLSGWEHVISHFLDLTAAADGRTEALHGAQVGVGTRISTRAYDRLWEQADWDRLLDDLPAEAFDTDLAELQQVYHWDEELEAEIRRDLAKKRSRWNQAGTTRQRFVERVRDKSLPAELAGWVRPTHEVEAALVSAGVPRTFQELEPTIPSHTATNAVRCAHLIRARHTLGDLLALNGQLTERHVEDLVRT